jgi:G:T-mismatch repair DNA endonuclease (very short patch repair protein)
MVDTLSPTARSERMSRVRRKNTTAEMIVRRLVHGMGFRYRLHRGDLAEQQAVEEAEAEDSADEFKN